MWQKAKNLYHFIQAFVAAVYFNFPSKHLTAIGVTGTDGKTTTAQMIYEIFKKSGQKVSVVSSIGAQIGVRHFDTGFHTTTPSPWQVQKYLRAAVNSGSRYFVLEATSHGLDQNRLAFIKFKVAVITNVTHEHLDYHKTQEQYLEAKSKLFRNVDYSILNLDDQSFEFLKSTADGKIITYSTKSQADFNLKKFPIKLKIPGDYNLQNALAAAAVASLSGVERKKISSALNNFGGVSGRMDQVDLGQKFQVFIDFAHTPNALKQALMTLAKAPHLKIISVFGSAGDRDRTKRPLMGKIAAGLADISVLTAEDPRREKVEDICSQIARGLIAKGKKEGKDYYIIGDRGEAINFAINLANKGDIVGLFGKAHEKSICFGKKEYPWDEFATVEKALNERLKHGK